MDYLAEKFARLGTDNAPGQEGLQKAEDLPMIGDKLEGPAVDFSHGDVNAHQPIPGSLETFVKHYCVMVPIRHTQNTAAKARSVNILLKNSQSTVALR